MPASVTAAAVKVVSGGGSFDGDSGATAAILANGTLLTWGGNEYGQLGNGTTNADYTPTALSSSPAFIDVAVGSAFMVGLKVGGYVSAWGLNDYGQLGNGTTTNSSTQVTVKYGSGTQLSGFIDVAATDKAGVALRGDGTVWTWGYGGDSELGDNSTASENVAVQVSALSNVKAIAAGNEHVLALRGDGTVWGWGSNSDGELGYSGAASSVPVQISLPLPARAISAGWYDSSVILSDGSIRNWGFNAYGQLGNNTTTNSHSPVTPSLSGLTAAGIASDRGSAIALISDGTVRTWGANASGDLGNNSTTQSLVPVTPSVSGVGSVWGGSSSISSFALAPADLVSAWGYNVDGEVGNGGTTTTTTPAAIAGLYTVKSVAVGCYHTLALLANGTVKAWGYNSNGQIGDNTTTTRTSPVTVSGLSNIVAVGAGCFHSIAVKADGTVYTWGLNTWGQLGNGGTTDGHVPAQVTSISKATAAVGGYGHSLVLLADGTMLAFGSDYQNQLGTTSGSNLSPMPVAISNVKQIAAGYAHSYAVLADGTVRTWGDNTYGELGLGNTTAYVGVQTVPGISYIDTIVGNGGAFQTVALDAYGAPKLWGNNTYGQLGNYPAAYSSAVTTPTTIYGISGGVRSIGAGYIDTYAVTILNDGYVGSVGDNSAGAFGLGSTTPANASLLQEESTVSEVTAIFGGAGFTVAMTH